MPVPTISPTLQPRVCLWRYGCATARLVVVFLYLEWNAAAPCRVEFIIFRTVLVYLVHTLLYLVHRAVNCQECMCCECICQRWGSCRCSAQVAVKWTYTSMTRNAVARLCSVFVLVQTCAYLLQPYASETRGFKPSFLMQHFLGEAISSV